MNWCACQSASCVNAHLWRELSPRARELLRSKLVSLYDKETDEAAFDALRLDKQQALRLIALRFGDVRLWRGVRSVTNVYGLGGVGFDFIASTHLLRALQLHKDFSSLLAKHKTSRAAFFELRHQRAALHLLRHEGESWSAHFDLYAPRGGLKSLARHLRIEKLDGVTPDWLAINHELESQSRQKQ